MQTVEKIKEAIKRGVKYDPETGIVYGAKGKPCNKVHSGGYLFSSIRTPSQRHYYYLHQFAFYWVHGYLPKEIDHKNQNKKDNRITNLRAASRTLNALNKKARGYSLKNGKYVSRIKVKGVCYYLGSFETAEAATKAYNERKAIEIKKLTEE